MQCKEKKISKSLYFLCLVFIFLFLTNINYSSSQSILLSPLDDSGNYQPGTTFNYVFNFSSDSTCTNILLSKNFSVTTNNYGNAVFDINLSSLENYPIYACEYRGSPLILRKVHSLTSTINSKIYTKDLRVFGLANFSGTIYINNATDISTIKNNPFNQNLNTTNNPTFQNITAYNGYFNGNLNASNFVLRGTNVILRREAGNVDSGEYQTIIGSNAGTGNVANYLTAIGRNAGLDNSGNAVLFIGEGSGEGNTGSGSVGIGGESMVYNTGELVYALGTVAGALNSGDNSVFIGDYSGAYNSGNYVIGIGALAAYLNTGNNGVFIGNGAGDSNSLNNQFIVQDSDINAIPLIQGNFSSGYVSIGSVATSFPLTVALNGTNNISIWASGSISADGFIDRTSVYDKSKGSVWNYIQDSDYYKVNDKNNNNIDHTKFYGYKNLGATPDYSTAIVNNKQVCKLVNDKIIYKNMTLFSKLLTQKNQKPTNIICSNVSTTTHNLVEKEGVSLSDEIAVLRQALYEQKLINEQQTLLNEEYKKALCEIKPELKLCK